MTTSTTNPGTTATKTREPAPPPSEAVIKALDKAADRVIRRSKAPMAVRLKYAADLENVGVMLKQLDTQVWK
jgi:hypothetical protein